MTLKEQLQDDVEKAMRSGDQQRRNVLRLMLAAIKQEEVDEGHSLNEEEVRAVLAKQAKQRRETIADAQRAGRREMAASERAELAIIKDYLPEQMDRDEIRALAREEIEAVGATGMKDMGQVMGRLMPRLKGRADGSVVSEVVRELLA
ncbi:MAG TPA: GatB/YqeY domain-containing protein [Candidatus Sulfomarinibacteraceae bacterium]|nr:GatB/YqeY domain-containing protein [Candidatus Sulfomarinibacteraceae bacterium]